ncbi:MAG: cation transporter, partial [Halobacteria archaeon]|nr:cation transporter [Halobacteria archaeon]
MSNGTPECELCGIPARERFFDDAGNVYCCQGCLEISRVLDEGDEGDEGDEDVDDIEELEDIDHEQEYDGDVSRLDETYLEIDGMHCSACEVFLEKTARETEGIVDAEASYATDILKLKYDSDAVDEDDLPVAVSTAGYNARLRGEENDASESIARLIAGGFFTMMIMVWYILFLYPSYAGLGFSLLDVSSTVGRYLLLNIWVMASVVVFYTGFPILRGAYVSLQARQPNMDLLIAIAVLATYVYSAVAVL